MKSFLFLPSFVRSCRPRAARDRRSSSSWQRRRLVTKPRPAGVPSRSKHETRRRSTSRHASQGLVRLRPDSLAASQCCRGRLKNDDGWRRLFPKKRPYQKGLGDNAKRRWDGPPHGSPSCLGRILMCSEKQFNQSPAGRQPQAGRFCRFYDLK